MTDRSEHSDALGEWCDCNGCLLSREHQADPSPARATIAEVVVLAEHERYKARLRSGVDVHFAERSVIRVTENGRPLSWAEVVARSQPGSFHYHPGPTPRLDLRKLVMWLLLAAFALGLAWLVGGP